MLPEIEAALAPVREGRRLWMERRARLALDEMGFVRGLLTVALHDAAEELELLYGLREVSEEQQRTTLSAVIDEQLPYFEAARIATSAEQP